MFKIYNEDCLERLKSIPDKSVDCIITDPPYGTTHCKWDSVIPLDKMWEQLNRIIKDNGAILLFCDGMFQAKLMLSNEKLWRYNLVWNKVLTSGFLNASKMPLRAHEEISVFYKKLPTYNPQFSEGKPLHGMGKHLKQTKNSNYSLVDATKNPSAKRAGDTKKYPISILTFSKNHPSICVHPTQKPTDLLEYLIKTYTNENETVLDFTMGSGSTGVACMNTNRNFIGIELDEHYFGIAKERITEADKSKNE